ncbi:tRNA-uridine aminocarboxypropyltransferase [Roseateles koreensis]|uniref:tRNA-uridine aminocarboxypropyltransferase n=1 Tax=Roseateles koreensis TaxID=2987526 RepID=A0ABT5KVU1_9BURK|nr:tRNA-uridine aminocarboxypropyltransferase [Roseateles koreensis]MDC8787059.1 DTW domain-containing protein [Roseateles koreensis]
MPHAVSRLRASRLALPTKPGLDRAGPRKPRCEACRLPPDYCMCGCRPRVPTRAGVCLVMAEFEALKPSNTGWLIADVIEQTSAFAWARTGVDPALLRLLADPQWQPYVVFPGEFADAQRVCTEVLTGDSSAPQSAAPLEGSGKRPLFVMLDGTWSEARKMFRKSPYLDAFPVLSLQPEQLSRYRLRRHCRDDHFCTAEVAALCLALAGETWAAQTLDAYLDVFTHRYLLAKQTQKLDPHNAVHQHLQSLQKLHTLGI